MTADVNQFLANQTRYRCERLCADLTVEQCQVNRERTGFKTIFACEGCAGIAKNVEVVNRTRTVITLDFSGDFSLYQRIQAVGITAEDIIGLLDMLLNNELRRVA